MHKSRITLTITFYAQVTKFIFCICLTAGKLYYMKIDTQTYIFSYGQISDVYSGAFVSNRHMVFGLYPI